MNSAITSAHQVPANDNTVSAPGPYAHYAAVFSRVYRETGSIDIALEVYETYRAREDLTRPKRVDFAQRVLQVSASLFSVPANRILERNRHRDVTSARYVAAWLLSRRRWSTVKIGTLLDLDHSTVLHGLRRVASDNDLLLAAHKAEHMLEVDEAAVASIHITPSTL